MADETAEGAARRREFVESSNATDLPGVQRSSEFLCVAMALPLVAAWCLESSGVDKGCTYVGQSKRESSAWAPAASSVPALPHNTALPNK